MGIIKNYMLTRAEVIKNQLLDSYFRENILTEEKIKEVTKSIDTRGYYVWPDFASIVFCEKIKAFIDEFIRTNSSKIWVDKEGADHRLWGVNRIMEDIAGYYSHPVNIAARENYYHLKEENIVGFSMANRISAIANNKGSGGGWHRDAVNIRQLKSILYLTEVAIENGPFEYIENTQHKSSLTDTILHHKIQYNQNRFSEKEIESILTSPKYKSVTLTAQMGTLILVDTTGIHRGKPIEKGIRYALTNYYWRAANKGGKGVPKHIEKLLIDHQTL